MIDDQRVEALANSFARLGHEGIAAFDKTEPEYSTLETLFDKYDTSAHVTLLGVLAASQDYQLNGDAQQFWRQLEETASSYSSLDSTQDVRNLLGDFMDADVNARLNSQKRGRLVRILEAGFDDWFIDNYNEVQPITVWEQFADALNNDMEAKTVVLSMKIYDIANLIQNNSYLDFPREIPIPCDLQVKRVSRTSGLTGSDNKAEVLEAWADVMESTSEKIGRDVSLLRIDSIVWQAGQIIGRNEPDGAAAQEALTAHFHEVGIDPSPAKELAVNLTTEL